MDDLPELPFEKILSYLSVEDRIKMRAVSRSCREKTTNSRLNTLCYSNRPSEFIFGKRRWVSGAFAQNFISSARLESFFATFASSILANLKRLRLCEVKTTAFETLNTFNQLEVLDIIRSGFPDSFKRPKFKLSLPMLQSIRLEDFSGVDRLSLDTPALKEMWIHDCLKQVEIVHVESVERVTIDQFSQMTVKHLKNLKQLYVRSPYGSIVDPALLSELEHLKELHLGYHRHVRAIFEQKQQYVRADLKVYQFGLLLNGPGEPNVDFARLVENQSRLLDENPFYTCLYYSIIESVAADAAISVVKRCSNLETVCVDGPVQDVPRFLDFLKNFNIIELFIQGAQPQELFDRLPEHCAVQRLTISRLPDDPEFLFRLTHLVDLQVLGRVNDTDAIRRVFEELEFLSSFEFLAGRKWVTIHAGKRFCVAVEGSYSTFVLDVNDAIQFIAEDARLRR